jgi:D-alanyl-lipoteichoic acid acyltransferase DltB (MBOAT superfamily)
VSFTSAEYVVLLAFSVCAYWAVKSNERARNLILLISSLIFYGFWSAPFLILLLATCSVDYFSALGIEQHRATPKARVFLIFAITLNLTVLGVFKYYDFFVLQTAKTLGLEFPVKLLALAHEVFE